jgi:hypothetical protein
LSLSGLDSVTFLLAAGPSEPLRPLADVASGGEAARVMLALKAAAAAVAANAAAAAAAAGPSSGPPTTSGPSSSSLEALPNSSASSAGSGSGSGPPPVLVLDELDAGVGSRLGSPIGRLLQTLVAGPAPTASQVLVVTHTPQVRHWGTPTPHLLCWFAVHVSPAAAVCLQAALCLQTGQHTAVCNTPLQLLTRALHHHMLNLHPLTSS